MWPKEVKNLMADRVEAFPATLARVDLNQVVPMMSLTNGPFFAELPILDADLHSSP